MGIAFCTDLTQVKAMQTKAGESLEFSKFKKEGCQYAQPCWQAQAADERYKSGELARFGQKSLRPWDKANSSWISKVFNEAGNLAKKGKSSTSLGAGRLPSAARNARPVVGPVQNVARSGPRRYQ